MIERYYQHVDVTDENTFLQTTSLMYIDDTDPSMVLYHFNDMTKCNEAFIGTYSQTNQFNINEFVFVEIPSQTSRWTCKKNNLFADQSQSVQNDKGETFYIPDRSLMDSHGNIRKNINQYVWTAPAHTTKLYGTDLKEYKISYIKEQLANGLSVDKEILRRIPYYVISEEERMGTKSVPVKTVEKDKSVEKSEEPIQILEGDIVPSVKSIFGEYIDVVKNTDPLTQPNTIVVPDKNGEISIELVKDLHNKVVSNALMIDDEYHSLSEVIGYAKEYLKSVKEVRSADVPQASNMLLKDADKTTVDFLCKMIQNAAKNIATAGVDIEIEVPPTDVYKLLKTAYPEEWSKIFIDLLATSVTPEALYQALADGLAAYYNAAVGETKTEE